MKISWFTYIQNAQLAFIIKDWIVEPDQGHVKVWSAMVALLVELVLGMDDELGDAKGVQVVAEAVAAALELGEGGDLLGANKELHTGEN
jgi:hypothetical protein